MVESPDGISMLRSAAMGPVPRLKDDLGPAQFFDRAAREVCGLPLAAGTPVLDFGCGRGELVRAFTGLGYDGEKVPVVRGSATRALACGCGGDECSDCVAERGHHRRRAQPAHQ